MGMRHDTKYHLLYYLGVVVFSVFYTLNYNVYAAHYNGQFGEFVIEPRISQFITGLDVIVAAIMIAIPVIFRHGVIRIGKLAILNDQRSKYIALGFIFLLVLQGYVLSSRGIAFASPDIRDELPYSAWELHVFDVIRYLETAEEGNVLSLRAPAIPFFTDRLTYDFYNPHAITELAPILSSDNGLELRQRLAEKNIRYVIVPNEASTLYHSSLALQNLSNIMTLVESDTDFIRLNFKNYDIYKLLDGYEINMLESGFNWSEFNYATIERSDQDLTVNVRTENVDKVYNRAVLTTKLELHDKPLILAMRYWSETYSGNATFYMEIRDGDVGRILWGHGLQYTAGQTNREVVVLPSVITGKSIEFRIYIISNGAGNHILSINQLGIAYA
jgi:hypothetical protein